jgi:hypothetical protein
MMRRIFFQVESSDDGNSLDRMTHLSHGRSDLDEATDHVDTQHLNPPQVGCFRNGYGGRLGRQVYRKTLTCQTCGDQPASFSSSVPISSLSQHPR